MRFPFRIVSDLWICKLKTHRKFVVPDVRSSIKIYRIYNAYDFVVQVDYCIIIAYSFTPSVHSPGSNENEFHLNYTVESSVCSNIILGKFFIE